MSVAADERLLIVAGHPDDETLGCGGTIARYCQAGRPVRVLCLAEGTSARFSDAELGSAAEQQAVAVREADARSAMAILGLAPDELFMDRRLCCRLDTVPQIELIKEIEAHLRDFGPTRVLTHCASDPNIDHRMVHLATLAAARPKYAGLRDIAAFEVPSSTDWNPAAPFAPTLFIDITATLPAKLAAIRAYGAEMPRPPHSRAPENIEALARVRGAQAGLQFAEGFQLLRRAEG